MDYQLLRGEAVKCAIELTRAMLQKDRNLIELNTFKLNHCVAEMLEKLEQKNENTPNKIERISKYTKK